MANIVLKTYAAGENNQGSVTPQNDALIYQAAIPMNGIFSGAVITLSSANVLHVAAGMGIIGGRFFEVLESDIPVQLSVSGDLLGRLYIHLDLSNADNPIEINAVTGASLPALQGDPDLNISNGVFDMELCTFDINELTISNIVQTFPTITAANNQIRRVTTYSVNDLVFCQSASKSLIFICTTAGTTAVQEPTAYATVTDGNTVTDGTAVFKAVSVSGQITKLTKTEVLISNSGDAYDPTRPYKVGELCIYNNVLYRCITACSAGSWATNQSCFMADTLVNVQSGILKNTMIEMFTMNPVSSNQIIFSVKGTYTPLDRIVTIIVSCHCSVKVESTNIALDLPAKYRPSQDVGGCGMVTVNVNEQTYGVEMYVSSDGKIVQNFSNGYVDAFGIIKYKI